MSINELLKYSESDRKQILECYGRAPENISKDIDNVKEWFSKQPHLPEIPDDKLIENFLLMNKFRIEQAKEKLEMYYSARTLLPEFFSHDPNGSVVQEAMQTSYTIPLPKLTADKHRVVVAGKLKDLNPDNFNAISYMALTIAFIEMRLRYDCNLAMIYVYDLAGIKPAHLVKLTPALLKKNNFLSKNVFVNKMHAVHLLNVPSYFDSYFNILKTFIKPKIANRIFTYTTLDSFNAISKDILPKDYDGEEKSLEELNNDWRKVFNEHDWYFKKLQSLKINEELRSGKPFTGELFGLEGNFRKLDLD